MADLIPQGEVQDAHTRSPRNFEGMKTFSHEDQYHSSHEGHDRMTDNMRSDDAEGPEEPEQTVNGKDKYTLSPAELRKNMK